MKLEPVPEVEFDAFLAKHRNGSFLQSFYIGRRRERSGWQMHPLALRNEESVIIAVAMLHSIERLPGLKKYECQMGPVVNDDDTALFEDMLRALKRYCVKHNGVSLLINPPVYVQADNPSDETVKKLFQSAGYQQINPKAIDKNEGRLRWYFIKDLTEHSDWAQVEASFEKRARSTIRTARQSNVTVEKITDKENLPRAIHLMRLASEREGFSIRDEEYFLSLFDEMPETVLHVMIATLPVVDYIAALESSHETVLEELDEIEKAGGLRREVRHLKDVLDRLTDIKAKQAQARDWERSGVSRLDLACAVFISYGQEMVYLASGSDVQYARFGGASLLQEWGIRYAYEHGIPRYNFYGSDGIHSGHPDQEGVLRFKRGFGGALHEQAGYYLFTAYTPWSIAHHVQRRTKYMVDKFGSRA